MDLKISICNHLNNLIDKNNTCGEKYSIKSINFYCIEDLEAFFCSGLSREDAVYISLRSSLHPILQKGPSCGIAALNMAVNFLRPLDTVPFDLMLQNAKNLELTSKGEYFIASDLLKLCNFYELKCSLIYCENKESMITSILSHLLENKLILIAYDRGSNNEPCMKNGHKAHWGLLTGILMQCAEDVLQFSNFLTRDESISALYHQNMYTTLLQEYLLSCANKLSNVYLMHGWSIHTRCVNINQLVESNWQIKEAGPDLKNKYKDMIIPDNMDICNLSRCFITLG